jgi:phosphoenolpyruvate carboxykinase (ATP)
MGKKVEPKHTLGILEAIVEKKAIFKPWEPFSDIEIFEIEGFIPNMKDKTYVTALKNRMNDRIEFIKSRETFKEGKDKLPKDALEALLKVISKISVL